jgi:hypothetical protein
VIITDGFVGNTVLKMAEGMAKSLFQAIAQEIFEIDPNLAIQFEPVVKQIYKKNDYHEYGGAPLLGVNGAMMIAHGSSARPAPSRPRSATPASSWPTTSTTHRRAARRGRGRRDRHGLSPHGPDPGAADGP